MRRRFSPQLETLESILALDGQGIATGPLPEVGGAPPGGFLGDQLVEPISYPGVDVIIPPSTVETPISVDLPNTDELIYDGPVLIEDFGDPYA